MFRYMIIIVLFVLSAASPAIAVDTFQVNTPDPVLEAWRWQSFPELKGLGLRCMAQDTEDNMWFGVDEGVQRYDGMHWTIYTRKEGLPATPINTLCATRDGSVYAGSDLGIYRFYGGVWHRVFPQTEMLPWPIDKILQVSDGTLWAATAWGALHLKTDATTLYTSKEMAATLRTLMPVLSLVIVPDEAVPKSSWPGGAGISDYPDYGWDGLEYFKYFRWSGESV